jgi:hypothetical protein
MPRAATLPAPTNAPNTQAATSGQTAGQRGPAPSLVPFTRASYEYVQQLLDVSQLSDGNTHIIGPFDIPAYGYLRSLLIMVDATGGTGAAAVAFEDAPWSTIATITFYDVDGAPTMSLSGHDLYIINKWGTKFLNDPVSSPKYSAVAATGNYAFLLRLPLEISNFDALGALPNQDSSATFKCQITMAANTGVYTTQPTTQPTVRFRCFMECWAQPNPTDLLGRPQQTEPPEVGTTQFWSKNVKVVGAGAQTIKIDRVGNLLKNIIFVFRNNTPVRDTTDFPDPIQIMWDGRIMTNEARDVRRHYMWERFGYAASALDTGVFVFDELHDLISNFAGMVTKDLLVPTTLGTLLTLVGNFVVAGNLTILVNDIQPKAGGQLYGPIQ